MGSFPHDRALKRLADREAADRDRRAQAEQAVNGLPMPQPTRAPPVGPPYPILRDSITGRT
jgi:hypothetical protein